MNNKTKKIMHGAFYMKKNTTLFTIIAVLLASLFISCYTPSPLYGTWSDNNGNTIKFMANGSYTSTITISGTKEDYKGEWSCVENVLVITKESGAQFTSEWDIRGSILYLSWVNQFGDNEPLRLYHVSKK